MDYEAERSIQAGCSIIVVKHVFYGTFFFEKKHSDDTFLASSVFVAVVFHSDFIKYPMGVPFNESLIL